MNCPMRLAHKKMVRPVLQRQRNPLSRQRNSCARENSLSGFFVERSRAKARPDSFSLCAAAHGRKKLRDKRKPYAEKSHRAIGMVTSKYARAMRGYLD